ncbi:MAG: NifU family protein [Devosia sp.]|nr:NifU family protein [Devosia sp.]
MFIQTEATPNPATLKFLPGRDVLIGEPRDFRNAEAAVAVSPLAAALFEVPGVTGVFLGSDFISVTKDVTEWNHIKPAILGVIMEHFLSGKPVLAEGTAEPELSGEEFFDATDSETVEVIKELLATRVRPAVAMDGGDITFKGYRDGTVFLHMQGACSGCPSSTATLKSGIENLLRHFVPGVEAVQQV